MFPKDLLTPGPCGLAHSPEPEHQSRSSETYDSQASIRRKQPPCPAVVSGHSRVCPGVPGSEHAGMLPRECSPPCPHTCGQAPCPGNKAGKGGWPRGWPGLGSSEAKPCTRQAHPHKGGTSETELTATLWRAAQRGNKYHSGTRHAATSGHATHTTHAREELRTQRARATQLRQARPPHARAEDTASRHAATSETRHTKTRHTKTATQGCATRARS